jgi:hypothetical protein
MFTNSKWQGATLEGLFFTPRESWIHGRRARLTRPDARPRPTGAGGSDAGHSPSPSPGDRGDCGGNPWRRAR